MAYCVYWSAKLGGLQSQLTGLQSQLVELQKEKDDPQQACDDQGLTGDDCILYIKSLPEKIASVQAQITNVNQQIGVATQQLTAEGCEITPIVGADGAPLTAQANQQGRITQAEAVGTDGVKRRFTRTFAFVFDTLNQQTLPHWVMRQEFFENDQRYFYATQMMYLWGRKVNLSWSGGGKDYGVGINFPADGSHDSTPITIASGAQGQPFTITKGTLNLNQGSLSALSFTADFAFPPEITQQVSKIAYFQQLFDLENKLDAAEGLADMQAAGIDPSMTLNEIWYGQGTGQAATAIHPLAPAGGGTISSGEMKGHALCWAMGGAIGGLGSAGGIIGSVLFGAFGGGFASYCADSVTNTYSPDNPQNPNIPPPSTMDSMPPDAGVSIDNGDAWDGGASDGGESGGDPGGICIQGEVPGGESRIVPFEETIGNCL